MLKCYGFGNLLISRIRVLYKNSKCCAVDSNFLSPFFDIKKGGKARKPLSSNCFCFMHRMFTDHVASEQAI